MTLVANHVALNSRVIGCNEHESYFAFDLIYHNNTDVKIDMLTGDNHSINQMNFVALDAINTEFTPSFASLKDQVNTLYSTRPVDEYSGFFKPKSQVDISLIKSQEREILRVLLSLILQHNTQATIVRKLSSHRRNLILKKALWEYNKISPVAWQHINFVGRYKFLSKGDYINFESLADILLEELESFLNR